ncbi:nitronate monooxygenase [Occallatibacter riparius]|uniref:Nitronate monooxygenase n=1 Tax=Occallatibacter riparius TaxID=1002689 RepID=A0A9J7BJM6_9BACT|nr:nitronate monooxygenase [Occallatibacter riparius]UWZ82739.1 nitronate monooxygenase [Occallatibacter riparius]
MFKVPTIIQGGMGVGISNWRLAQAVSLTAQLGVVSGTALDQVLVRRLADGDPSGAMRRALAAFPFPAVARRILDEFFIAGGKPATQPYPALPLHSHRQPRKLVELCMAANFAEVFLAREGHQNPVGINFLEKVQLPHLASIYGAMLAGVGYVLMGAGIPSQVPGILDAFAARRPAEYRLSVSGGGTEHTADATVRFDPADYADDAPLPSLTRPTFLAIVSSHTLAASLLRRASGRVDGFVVEGPTAGGHNAPPRGKLQLNASGEPLYGDRDRVNLAEMRALGVPFWLAGGYGSPEKLAEALAEGASGVQVGTAFAFSEESGLRSDLKRELLAQAVAGTGRVLTDPLASPTGFPFKVAQLAGTASDSAVAALRPRLCDVGLLREPYVRADGELAWRCSAEPLSCYVAKGGAEEATVGRKCLCNALLANIGHAQLRTDGVVEPPLVTLGDDINTVARYLRPGEHTYSAADVIEAILQPQIA